MITIPATFETARVDSLAPLLQSIADQVNTLATWRASLPQGLQNWAPWYWRIRIDAGGYSGYCAVSCLEFRSVHNGSTICSGGTPLCSTQYSSNYGPSWAFNRDDAAWISKTPPSYPEWIGYKLASPAQVVEIAVMPYYSNLAATPTDWMVQASSDGIQWYDVWKVTGQTWNTQRELRVFTP